MTEPGRLPYNVCIVCAANVMVGGGAVRCSVIGCAVHLSDVPKT
jgi:hypothetical protein